MCSCECKLEEDIEEKKEGKEEGKWRSGNKQASCFVLVFHRGKGMP